MVVVPPFVRQRFMLPFWRIMHLIFAYDIELRAHIIEYPWVRDELMLYVARLGIVDLPLYIFLTLRFEAKMSSTTALPYSLLLHTSSIVLVAWIVETRKGRRPSVPSVRLL